MKPSRACYVLCGFCVACAMAAPIPEPVFALSFLSFLVSGVLA